MALPKVVSADEWLAERMKLLAEEKELTRRIDAISTKRRQLPMVRVDKPYRFVGADGEVGLRDLFRGRRQLIVQHVMYEPHWDEVCPSCTASIDELPAATLDHLAARETSYALVSRAPCEKLAGSQRRKGWPIPWYSSFGSDFNYDFDVTMDPSVKPPVYNYRPLPPEDYPETSAEQPGLSCFLLDGDDIYHTYSTYARGTDQLGGGYTFLDLTALGRQEAWEEPKGRVEFANDNRPDFS